MNYLKMAMPVMALASFVACGGGGGEDPVLGPPPVARIAVEPAAPAMETGATTQFSATLYDSNNRVITGRTVNWASSDSSVASVTQTGMVTAVKAGPARITASVGSTEGLSNVTVSDPPPAAVARVTVSPENGIVEEGDTHELTATAYDAQDKVITGRGVSWTIQDNSIATIDGAGIITALRTGSTSATARIDGKSATASVKIEASYPFELLYGRYAVGSNPGAFVLDLRDPAATARSLQAGSAQLQQVTASPDGLRIAYVVAEASATSIWVANRDGSNPRALLADGNFNDQPAWSPDGSQIAFRHRPAGSGTDIWVMNSVDGSDARNLTAVHGATGQNSPTWSPVFADNSLWIAYSHAENGAAQIWAMRSDGSDHQQITTNMTVFDDQPNWSPDGSQIVFQRSGDAIFGDLYIVNASGGNGRLLMQLAGPLAGGQFSPTWSPDGQLIAFSSRHGGNWYQVYTVWFDGTRLAQRTFDEADHDYPRWMMLTN